MGPPGIQNLPSQKTNINNTNLRGSRFPSLVRDAIPRPRGRAGRAGDAKRYAGAAAGGQGRAAAAPTPSSEVPQPHSGRGSVRAARLRAPPPGSSQCGAEGGCGGRFHLRFGPHARPARGGRPREARRASQRHCGRAAARAPSRSHTRAGQGGGCRRGRGFTTCGHPRRPRQDGCNEGQALAVRKAQGNRQLKVCGNPVSSKSMRAPFSSSMCLLDVSATI
ncbi:uncharacterized protein [Dasypus novemcinctus]|uniref:uncharacterized protein n=1 Tax=Dasypus novemcinctus TaxID=9361 RepID=UPI0039C99DA0